MSPLNPLLLPTDYSLVDRLRLLSAHHPALHTEINEAADALERMDALLRAMQSDVVAYLVPDSPHNKSWLVSRLLYRLDGPQQRAAQDGVKYSALNAGVSRGALDE